MNILDKLHRRSATLADQEEALKEPETAYLFALYVLDADIEKCQEVACREPNLAFSFATHISRANIKKCQEAVLKYPKWAYLFAKYIPGADIKMSLELCRGTVYESMLNEYLMERALL